MKNYCIYYPTSFGKAEYWLTAKSKMQARSIFENEHLKGNLDYPCIDLLGLEIVEIER